MSVSGSEEAVIQQPESKYASKPDICQLCHRKVWLTFHHLIPRKVHRRNYYRKHFSREVLAQGIWICRKCHSGLHRLYDEMQLAKQFSSIEQIEADPAIQKHVKWIAKQRA